MYFCSTEKVSKNIDNRGGLAIILAIYLSKRRGRAMITLITRGGGSKKSQIIEIM